MQQYETTNELYRRRESFMCQIRLQTGKTIALSPSPDPTPPNFPAGIEVVFFVLIPVYFLRVIV